MTCHTKQGMCSLIPVQEKLQENTGCFWVSFRHKAQSAWDYEPANYKETNGLLTSRPLLNIVCLMAVMQYLSRVMVHGTLQPVSRQSICNHHIDIITSSNGNIFPCYWSFVRGIHRSGVNSPHEGQWHGALVFSFICAWTKDRANNRSAGDLGHHRAQYDVTVMT